MMANLLNSKDLRKEIELLLPKAKSVSIISGYITTPAVKWLSDLTANRDVRVNFVCRFSPQDVACGASEISAARTALGNGWNFYILPNLHAKIYLIDKSKMFVGSANFTNNGFMMYGRGNIEACVQVDPKESDVELIESFINSSTALDIPLLDDIEEYIAINKEVSESNNYPHQWPSSIVPENEDIWVADFPFVSNENALENEDAEHDADIFFNGKINKGADLSKFFKQSKSFKWLLRKLSEKDSKSASFGELSSLLHNELMDDPSPYRKNVKELLAGLLEYCQKYATDNISVTIPSHSQVVSIKK